MGDAWVWDWDDVLKASVVFAEIYFVDDHAMVTSRLGDRFHVTRSVCRYKFLCPLLATVNSEQNKQKGTLGYSEISTWVSR